MDKENLVGGFHAVEAMLRSERSISKILISDSVQKRRTEIFTLAKEKGIVVQEVPSKKVNDLLPGAKHQGIIALVSPVQFHEIDEMIDLARKRNEDPLLILLDGIEDPRNLGAVVRSAECFGAHGIIIPKRGASPITSVVETASAGALERVMVAQVGNMSQTIDRLKKEGLWTVGMILNEQSSVITKAELSIPLVLILGNEGKGISALVQKKCDFLLHVPMRGDVGSLNVSVAAGIGLYEIQRQKTN